MTQSPFEQLKKEIIGEGKKFFEAIALDGDSVEQKGQMISPELAWSVFQRFLESPLSLDLVAQRTAERDLEAVLKIIDDDIAEYGLNVTNSKLRHKVESQLRTFLGEDITR